MNSSRNETRWCCGAPLEIEAKEEVGSDKPDVFGTLGGSSSACTIYVLLRSRGRQPALPRVGQSAATTGLAGRWLRLRGRRDATGKRPLVVRIDG